MGINVTPLVDITLVLLIIFMATAHIIVHRSMSLSLPKVANAQNVPTQSIQILLEADKSLRLNNRTGHAAGSFREFGANGAAGSGTSR